MSTKRLAFYLLATVGTLIITTILTSLGAGVFSWQFWVAYLGIITIVISTVGIITEEE